MKTRIIKFNRVRSVVSFTEFYELSSLIDKDNPASLWILGKKVSTRRAGVITKFETALCDPKWTKILVAKTVKAKHIL